MFPGLILSTIDGLIFVIAIFNPRIMRPIYDLIESFLIIAKDIIIKQSDKWEGYMKKREAKYKKGDLKSVHKKGSKFNNKQRFFCKNVILTTITYRL